MPFDPNLPQENTPVDAVQMRDQFNGLKELIDAIPAGPAGPQGIQGPPFANAVVDAVDTLSPGDPATVSTTFDGTDVHFTFGIPQGVEGPQGPPFSNAVVDAVDTLSPGDPATVSTSFDGTDVHFTFGIPQGATGEVSAADLSAAIDGTSTNSNAVATLGMSVSDPPTQAEVQTIADKLDELINALRR